MFIIKKQFSGDGSRLIKKFIITFQNNIENFILNYAEKSIRENELEHIFWYGEQQIKTAVTCSLNESCNGYFMQEPAVNRKKKINTNVSYDEYSNGRLDYWCRFGDITKISILIEVKHHWINIYKNMQHTLYKEVINRHLEAIKQIKNIKKSDYIIDNLYGVALTILPIFTRYKSLNNNPLLMDNNSLEILGRKILKQVQSNACSGFIIPNQLQSITDFHNENTSKIEYQSFPGVILLWNISKFTRT